MDKIFNVLHKNNIEIWKIQEHSREFRTIEWTFIDWMDKMESIISLLYIVFALMNREAAQCHSW